MQGTVLHIAPTPFFSDRGCHIRIEGIIRSLKNLGLNNHLCTYHHGRDIEGISTSRIKPISGYTQTEAGPSKYKPLADFRLLFVSLREYRRLRPEYIHAHLHEGLFIGLIIKVIFFWHKTKLIADMQGSLTGELESHGAFKKVPLLKRITHLFERVLMWFPNHIICSSRHSLEKIKNEFGLADTKISLAQDGADAMRAINNDQKVNLKEELQLPNDKIIAVYSGALLTSKGLNELQELILASANIETLHFLVIGYPIDQLDNFLAENKLKHKCSLTGRVEFSELPKLLQLCDIGIDPKNSDAGEGSGKMLNYLACGLAVIAFDTENNADFLPTNTLLAGNSEELAQQLKLLTEDRTLREESAQKNQIHFNQSLSWEACENQLKAVYSSFKKNH